MKIRGVRRVVAVAMMAAVLASAPGIAQAKDLCVTISGYNVPFVFKGFAVPGKGKCKPLAGFLGASVISGTACTSTDGTIGHFMLLDQSLETNAFNAPLPFPSSATDQYCIANTGFTGSCSYGSPVSVTYCASPVAIP